MLEIIAQSRFDKRSEHIRNVYMAIDDNKYYVPFSSDSCECE